VFTYKGAAIVTPNSDMPCSLILMDVQAASRSIRNATISRKERTSRINLGQALGGRLSYRELSAQLSLPAQSPVVAPLR
jgi:hypothetical protein